MTFGKKKGDIVYLIIDLFFLFILVQRKRITPTE